MTERPLRARVQATHPSVRAGLRALLIDAGIDVVTGADDTFDDDAVDVDVEVRDLADDAVDESPPSASPVLWLIDDLVEAGTGDGRGGGYLRRDASAEELAAAARAVAAGLRVIDPRLPDSRNEEESLPPGEANDGGLTAREIEVLQLVAMGLPNKTIALELGISDHTVKSHVGAILGKLQASSRTEAVMAAARSGLLAL